MKNYDRLNDALHIIKDRDIGATRTDWVLFHYTYDDRAYWTVLFLRYQSPRRVCWVISRKTRSRIVVIETHPSDCIKRDSLIGYPSWAFFLLWAYRCHSHLLIARKRRRYRQLKCDENKNERTAAPTKGVRWCDRLTWCLSRVVVLLLVGSTHFIPPRMYEQEQKTKILHIIVLWYNTVPVPYQIIRMLIVVH